MSSQCNTVQATVCRTDCCLHGADWTQRREQSRLLFQSFVSGNGTVAVPAAPGGTQFGPPLDRPAAARSENWATLGTGGREEGAQDKVAIALRTLG